jgi:hypothetical protein
MLVLILRLVFLMECTQAKEQFSCHVLRNSATMFSERKVKMSKARKGTYSEAQYSYFSTVDFRDAMLHTHTHARQY